MARRLQESDLVPNNPDKGVLRRAYHRYIREHYADHGSIPRLNIVENNIPREFRHEKTLGPTRIARKMLKELEQELINRGIFDGIGEHTGRPHLTEYGFEWIKPRLVVKSK